MDWDARYRTQDTPWDKGEAVPSLEVFVSEVAGYLGTGSRVLVPGCGFGHDAALLADLGFTVDAVDLSALAVERAEVLYGGKVGLTFKEVDLFKYSVKEGYDWAWEHTCFCAIEPSQRRAYMESLAALVKDGGYLAGVFFLNPDVEPGEGPPFGATVAEICEVANGLFDLVLEADPVASYEGREGRERMLLFRKTC